MKKMKGFSLIELLIVVAIILIIAAIAIPNLVKARLAANEGSATASIRTIGSSQMLYRSSNGAFGTLAQLSTENLIDNVLGSGSKSGYSFATTPGASPALEFTANADPLSTHTVTGTGKRYFFTDQTQVIRFNTAGGPDSSSPAID